jgi:hypothetical protein
VPTGMTGSMLKWFLSRRLVLVLVGAGALFSCGSEPADRGAALDSGSDASRGGSGAKGAAGKGGAVSGGAGGSSGAGFGGANAGGVGGAGLSSGGSAGTTLGDASPDAPDALGDASWTCSGTCSAFCRNVIAQNCSDPDAVLHDQAACEAACAKPFPRVPADCDCTLKNYLECAAAARIQCPRRRCNDSGVCVDESMKVLGCEAEDKAFDACAGACLHEGNTNGGGSAGSDAGPGTSYEYISTGCVCPPLATGLAPGSSCTSARDCAQFCCDCASDRGKFVGQLCLEGRCVGAAEGCVPSTSRTSGMCRGQTP